MSCASCFRGLLSFIILLNMVIGLALVGTSIWLYLDGAEFWIFMYDFNIGPVIAEIEYFQYVLYSILILGAIKVFMSFLGCCSVSRKFFILVQILFTIQIAAGVCVWYFKNDFTAKSTEALTLFVREGYESMNTTTDLTLDQLQAKHECCGSVEPSDWSTAVYNEGGEDKTSFEVPPSCCISSDPSTCNSDRKITNNDIGEGTIYTKGCSMEILNKIYDYVYRYETLGILLGYVLFEYIVMTLRLFACRKKYDDYEDSHMMELKPYR